MLNNEHVGKVLLYMYDTVKIEKIGMTSNGKEWYFINNNYPEEANGYYDLWDQITMDRILSKQEEYKINIEKRRIREAEQEAREQEEARLQAERENLYGFDNGKTPMQKGKILKILMTKYHYKSNNVDIGHMTRKDFVYKMLAKENYIIEHLTNLKYWKKDGYKIKENEYRLVAQDGSFYEITKTEYDFAKYLIDNDIFKAEEIAI